MSLIYVGCEEGRSGAGVRALYHNMDVANPFWPRASTATGTIRYELFLDAPDGLNTVYFGIPYESVTRIEDASDTFVETFSERTVGSQTDERFTYDGEQYTLHPISEGDITLESATYDGIDYTTLTITDITEPGNIALSFELDVERMAVNVADSLFFETIWSLDVTLYGPVNPREHSFLDEEELDVEVLDVKNGYSYLYLPEGTFPKQVSPEPLESFFRGSENQFYYTWVVGNLDPWYEQRMMITYGSHDGNHIAAIIASIIASIIFLIMTVVPEYVPDVLAVVRSLGS